MISKSQKNMMNTFGIHVELSFYVFRGDTAGQKRRRAMIVYEIKQTKQKMNP